jgi:hypothetical protein
LRVWPSGSTPIEEPKNRAIAELQASAIDENRHIEMARDEIAASAIDPALAAVNTFWLDGDDAIARFTECTEIDGFTKRSQIDAQWRALRKKPQIQAVDAGALFFQGIDPLTDSDLAWVRCKPVQPRGGWKQNDAGEWYETGKIVKYETIAGEPLRVSFFRPTAEIWQRIADHYSVAIPTDGTTFWQWVQINPEIELIIAEGEKKALSLMSAGYVAVSVPGINCGYRKNINGTRSLHPDLLPFANRRVIIAYDQDEKQSTRLKVDGAINTTAKLLSEAGAIPLVAKWDSAIGKGIDDFIAASGDLDHVIEQASSPPDLNLYFARRAVANRLGKYRPNLSVCVPCLSAINPESIPESGIVAIIGGTGTGKTKLLSALQQEKKSALAPGHRTSLQRGLSERLGLTYIKDADRGNGYLLDANGNPTRKIGLCFDSLLGIPVSLYPDGGFDLILDEADQGFKHLISGGTCGKDGKRPALVQRAIDYVTGAKRVILASATLTRHEIDLVAQYRGESPWILENTYKANAYPIEIYSGTRDITGSSSKNRGEVIGQASKAIRKGDRVIAACDQLLTAKMIANAGEKLGLQPDQILRFDRETSSEDRQREFAANPAHFLAQNNIRLLVHSPSLTSGVSIEGDHFDINIGIFEGQTISPDDALQALARVRRPIPRVIYASHYGKGNAKIDATRLGDYLEQSGRRATAIAKVNGKAINIDSDSPIAIYHAKTQADRNASMANFAASLQARLEDAGHQITIGSAGDPTEAIALWNQSRQDVTTERHETLRNTPQIDESKANELRVKKTLTHSEALKLERYELCHWYDLDPASLTIDDIKYDRRGQQRRKLARLEGHVWDGYSQSKDAESLDQLSRWNMPIASHDLPGRELDHQAAKTLGVPEFLERCIKEPGWNDQTEWVQIFAAKMRQYAADVKLALGFRIHDNMTDCQIAGMVLNSYGFRTKSRRLGSRGDRRRCYQLNQNSIDRIKEIFEQRSQRHIDKGFKPCPHPLTKLLLAPTDTETRKPPLIMNAPMNEAQNTSRVPEKNPQTELRPPTIPG